MKNCVFGAYLKNSMKKKIYQRVLCGNGNIFFFSLWLSSFFHSFFVIVKNNLFFVYRFRIKSKRSNGIMFKKIFCLKNFFYKNFHGVPSAILVYFMLASVFVRAIVHHIKVENPPDHIPTNTFTHLSFTPLPMPQKKKSFFSSSFSSFVSMWKHY